MPIVNLQEEMAKVEQRLNNPEEMLGKGLMQPFTNTNSGSRKIMFGTQLEHRLPLMSPEVALIQTGYEDQFGRYSSSFVESDSDYDVIAKISKFSSLPNHHYYLIIRDVRDKHLSVIERISFKHITETYGYLYNNDDLDRLDIDSTIFKNQVIQKSQSFDNYNNRMDGVNLITAYLSCEHTMEDGVILSETAADKLTSPLLKHVTVVINDNDIPLNLYGTDEFYKSFPDIGEEIRDSIFCAIRREKKEESLYTQSYNRLKTILMSDDKIVLEGKVIDINIYCNNPENLQSSFYYNQLKYYYNESLRCNNELVQVVNEYVSRGYELSYDLQKLFFNAKRMLTGSQYINDRPFSNVILDVMVLEENRISVGDKVTDRYGGKGVVSIIIPDEMMPLLDNGNRIEMINNQNTCVNRENAGQLFEVSINHISDRLSEYIQMGVLDVGEALDLLLQYFSKISPELAEYVEEVVESFHDEDELIAYVGSFSTDEGIKLSIKPISESMDIDKLNEIYKAFPWAVPNRMLVPIKDSNGNTRFIMSRRPIIAGKKYVYRLKQYAEEKFSATSLSSTNIKNENSRNKSNRSFKSLYTRTPIRFGEMETGDLGHLGMEVVITNLMLHSTSPHARRLAEQLLTGDPFNIDIKLDMGSKNRSVEIVQAYLKTMGLKLIFSKKYKNLKVPALMTPAYFVTPDSDLIQPAFFVDKDNGEVFDSNYLEKYEKMHNGLIVPAKISPCIFLVPDVDVNEEK